MDRRLFLCSSAAALAAFPLLGCVGQETWEERLFSATKGSDTFYYTEDLSLDERPPLRIESGWRGHGLTLSPQGSYLVQVARRPGWQMRVTDTATGATVALVDAAPGRHFMGHAVFSSDGSLLYATENVFFEGDLTPKNSVVGVYDTRKGFARIAEYSTFGVGAHELLLCDDKIVVANGGIYTHPDRERESLNLSTMQPSLVYLDEKGEFLEEAHLPNSKLSIRHLACNGNTLAVATQNQDAEDDQSPLIFVHSPGATLRALEAPNDGWAGLRGYTGSVAIHPEGVILATSPRGNRGELWNSSGEYLGGFEANDVSGVAPARSKDAFLCTTGTGQIIAVSLAGSILREWNFTGRQFDNHVVSVG